MKKIFNSKFLLIAALSISIGACTDLNNTETDSIIPKATSGGGGGDPTQLLEGAYKDLGAYTDQNNIYALGEHGTAEMIPPTRGVDWGDNGVWRTLDQHTWDATHSANLGAWNQLNQFVYKCNQVLAASPSVAQAAEAKFLRAFHMYNVMDYWGQVPFRNTTDGVDVNPKVFSRSEAFDFILKDLEEALAGLSKKGPAAINAQASKAAANFMLAKMYLNKAVYKSANPAGPFTFDAADMNKVIGYVDAITADGYSLEDKYFDNFSTAASKEIIFVSNEGSPQNRWMMTLHYDQDPSGWNGFTTLADFYGKFTASDQRRGFVTPKTGKAFDGIDRGFLRGQQYKNDGTKLVDSRSKKDLVFSDDVPLAGAATEKGIRVIKYHPANSGKYIFARYGDALMMKAEAQLRGGTGGAAAALLTVNALRLKRSNTTPVLAPLASIDLKGMADERSREVYWEIGSRTDEVRFGTFLTGPGVVNKDPGTVLYPIPANAVTSNPNLKQNPGY